LVIVISIDKRNLIKNLCLILPDKSNFKVYKLSTMHLQLLKDGNGNNSGIFINMADWEIITQK